MRSYDDFKKDIEDKIQERVDQMEKWDQFKWDQEQEWKLKYEDIPDHLKQYWDHSSAVRRNQFGQPVYGKECQECFNHEEEWYNCDLCHSQWVEKRIHITRTTSHFPGYMPTDIATVQHYLEELQGGDKRRPEILFHVCPKMPKMLTHLLACVIL